MTTRKAMADQISSAEHEAPTLDLASRVKALGAVKILDLEQSAIIRGIYHDRIHHGIYYLRPPDGVNAAALQKLFDEYRSVGAIHLAYNAQSALDINHKPILPLDGFAGKYFGEPALGLLKVTAVARGKVSELEAIIAQFREPFNPESFPGIDQLAVTQFKPPSKVGQTTLSLRVVNGEWRDLTRIEEEIKDHLAETSLVREILVSRHSVKGLDAEIILASTEAISKFGNSFLTDLASHLIANPPVDLEVRQEVELDLDEVESEIVQLRRETPKEDPSNMRRRALEVLGQTLGSMTAFTGKAQSMSAGMLLVEFPRVGLLGIGGHFGKEHVPPLGAVVRVVRASPGLHEGWAASYSYSKATRLLTIKVTPEGEATPPGWTPIQ